MAFDGLFALAATTDCDILIATDPDSDRIGVAAKDANGVWQLITGNQLGALLIDYLAEVRGVKEGDTIITTTVTSQFSKALAHYHGFELEETFTGFKYIGNAINATIANPARTYVFGFQ